MNCYEHYILVFQGQERAVNYRYITGKLGLIAFGILCTHYYFKYNGNVSTYQIFGKHLPLFDFYS